MAIDVTPEIMRQVERLTAEERRKLVVEIERSISEAIKPRVRSLLDLRGLGKEIWTSIDVKEYLRNERDS